MAKNRPVQFNSSPPPKLAAVDSAVQERTRALNESMTMQAQFFTLRAQLFNSYITTRPNTPPLDCHVLAHKAASMDFMSRVEKAQALLLKFGETMNLPKLYDVLKAELDGVNLK